MTSCNTVSEILEIFMGSFFKYLQFLLPCQ